MRTEYANSNSVLSKLMNKRQILQRENELLKNKNSVNDIKSSEIRSYNEISQNNIENIIRQSTENELELENMKVFNINIRKKFLNSKIMYEYFQKK